MKIRIVLFNNHPKFTKLLPLFLLLLLPAIALANDLSDQINAVTNNLNSLQKEIDDLDKNIGQPLVAEKAHLSDTDDLLKGAEKNLNANYNNLTNRITGPGGYSAQFATHQAKVASLDARTTDYNRRCSGTFSDRSYVDACNREKAQLDAEADAIRQETVQLRNLRSSLLQEKVELDSYSKGLQDRRNDLSQATLNWAAKVKRYNADRNDLLASYNKALAQLKQLKYDNCVRRLPQNAKIEYIKHKCGNVPFDGANPNLPPCTTDKCKEADRLFK